MSYPPARNPQIDLILKINIAILFFQGNNQPSAYILFWQDLAPVTPKRTLFT